MVQPENRRGWKAVVILLFWVILYVFLKMIIFLAIHGKPNENSEEREHIRQFLNTIRESVDDQFEQMKNWKKVEVSNEDRIRASDILHRFQNSKLDEDPFKSLTSRKQPLGESPKQEADKPVTTSEVEKFLDFGVSGKDGVAGLDVLSQWQNLKSDPFQTKENKLGASSQQNQEKSDNDATRSNAAGSNKLVNSIIQQYQFQSDQPHSNQPAPSDLPKKENQLESF